MRNIKKSGYTIHKKYKDTANGFDDLQIKKEIRETLVRDQHFLCCYCMGRIEGKPDDTKIEHHMPQSLYPELIFEFSNLLAACKSEGTDCHCDSSKGNTRISKNPAIDNVEALIRYDSQGKIVTSNSEFKKDIEETLNLNQMTLVNRRKGALSAIKTTINKDFPGSTPNINQVQKYITSWSKPNSNGKLPPYCQVVISYLQKRLKSEQNSK